jgi:hypothetical protein
MNAAFDAPDELLSRYENPSTPIPAGEGNPASAIAGASISTSSFSSGFPSPAERLAEALPGRLRPKRVTLLFAPGETLGG